MSINDVVSLRWEMFKLIKQLEMKINMNTSDIADIVVALPDDLCTLVDKSVNALEEGTVWVLTNELQGDRAIVGLFETRQKAELEKARLRSEGYQLGDFTIEPWRVQ